MIELLSKVHNLILLKMEKEELNLESKDALKNILQEYVIHTKVVEDQLQMCKKDHVELRSEITRLVTENRDLYQQLRSYSESGLHGEKFVGDNSELVDNLRQQLALALEENKYLEGLWKSSLEELGTLEEKLQHLQSGKELSMVQSRLNDAQKNYTEAIKMLESKLSAIKAENDQLTVKTQMLENQLMQVTSQMAIVAEKNLSLTSSLKAATTNELDWKSRYLDVEAKYIEMDRHYQADKVKYAHTYEYEKVESHLKEKLEGAIRQRDDLQTALERCHERMAEMLRNAASDRNRIEEAIALVEGAIRDRDEALDREASSAEQLKKMKTELNSLVEEAGQRVAQEAVALKANFDSQLTSLRDQLQLVDQERTRKCIEVQQLQKECSRLETLLEQTRIQGVPDGRDRQLERVYRELQAAEAACMQLRMENEELHNSLDKLQDRCRKTSREKMKLKHELQSAEQQCQLCQHELAITCQRAELLNSQLQNVSLELAQLQSETIFQRENGTDAQAKISVANTIELYKRLDDSYGKMNDKWKTEMNALTEKFEEKLTAIKEKYKILAKKEKNKNVESIDHSKTVKE